ncbi:class I SAM-dependent methyltransferase [Pseudofulvibacter geojedonensis]|uniref:Class I SAM-dependent methyltransferase n=1 Tax=Pseudofulvibacter geojedonensis TaxID=1123758 RepID=A0ABW3I5R1_9FLAO
MKKSDLSQFLRKFKLIHLADKTRFYIEKRKNKAENEAFKKEHPSFKFPPDYLMYESFQMSYRKYYESGKKNAEWLTTLFCKHIELKNKKILDWGCGPGRIIRHLPEVISNNCSFYGTDYNQKSIKWCSENLSRISFNHNTIDAKLPYSDNEFDVIYGLSIITHLSEDKHYEWFQELYRILKPNGILLLTAQGDNFISKLTTEEQESYNNGELIVRGNVTEGHRVYSAFHPTPFMQKLFKNANIVDHIIQKPIDNWIPQDIWIVKKD